MGCFPWKRQRGGRSAPGAGSSSVKVRGILKTPCEPYSLQQRRSKRDSLKLGGGVSFKEDIVDQDKGDAIATALTDISLPPDDVEQPPLLPENSRHNINIAEDPSPPNIQPSPPAPPPPAPPQQQQQQQQPLPPAPATSPSGRRGSLEAFTDKSQSAASAATTTTSKNNQVSNGPRPLPSPPTTTNTTNTTTAGRLADLQQRYRQRSNMLDKGPTFQPVQIIPSGDRFAYDSFTAGPSAASRPDTVRSAQHAGGVAATTSTTASDTAEYNDARQPPLRRLPPAPSAPSLHSAANTASNNGGSGAGGVVVSSTVYGASWLSGHMTQSKRLAISSCPPPPPIVVPQHRLESITALPGSLPSVTRGPKGGAGAAGGHHSTHGPAGYSSSAAPPLLTPLRQPPSGLLTSELLLSGGKTASAGVPGCGPPDRVHAALAGRCGNQGEAGGGQGAAVQGEAGGGGVWTRQQQQGGPAGGGHAGWPLGGGGRGGGGGSPPGAHPGSTPPAQQPMRPTTAAAASQQQGVCVRLQTAGEPTKAAKGLSNWDPDQPLFPPPVATGVCVRTSRETREPPQPRAVSGVARAGAAPDGGQQGGDSRQLPVATGVVQRIEAAKANEAMLASLLSGGRRGVDMSSQAGASNSTVDELLRFDRVSDAMSRLEGIMATGRHV